MENSNIKKIPLDSNINIKSEDMLEDVNNPTFIDNPQQYQGRYLPNSLGSSIMVGQQGTESITLTSRLQR